MNLGVYEIGNYVMSLLSIRPVQGIDSRLSFQNPSFKYRQSNKFNDRIKLKVKTTWTQDKTYLDSFALKTAACTRTYKLCINFYMVSPRYLLNKLSNHFPLSVPVNFRINLQSTFDVDVLMQIHYFLDRLSQTLVNWC